MLWTALPLLLLQSPVPRDVPPPQVKTGTAAIHGRVTAADTNQPLRGAVVWLTGGPPTTNPGRSTATDARGRFAFTGLVAGTYRVRAGPGNLRGQYLPLTFGARRNNEPGDPIELKDGDRFDRANVALPRGAAISGRVVDEFGDPVTRASVFPVRVRAGVVAFQRGGMAGATDDLGQFRIFGLEPGEYIIGAEMRMMSGPPVEGPSDGFMITYHPSTSVEREAARLKVAAAEDLAGIEIRLVRTRTFRVSGTLIDSHGRPVSNAGGSLFRLDRADGSVGSSIMLEPGKFTIRDVPPGDYRFFVQPYSSAAADPARPQRREYADVPVTVMSNIDDLVVVTQPGTTITGQVVFAEGAPATPPSGLRVMVQPADRTMPTRGPWTTAVVDANLQFTVTDLFGPNYVRTTIAGGAYALKAVMLGDTDISDTPVRFLPEHNGQLRVVLTSRGSVLEGIVRDEKGEPAAGATVVAIPEEKSSWRTGALRLRFTMTPKDGKFTLRGLLPGRYYVAAVQGEQVYLGAEAGPEMFEAVTKAAAVVVIGEGEKRALDLQVVKP